MSSLWAVEALGRGIVRRLVSLPEAVIGEFSRALGLGNRRYHPTVPMNFPAFLDTFESQYGSSHPFFYACRLTEALKMAEEEKKFLFLYLHSKDHPFTPGFCRGTLCSDLAIQFLDANFICWGGLADRGEGAQMSAALQPGSFPICALVTSAPANSIAILRQIEGPISPAELVEILQRTVEEQGPAFGLGSSSRTRQDEKIRADRRLREEQDAAFLAALQIDKARDAGRIPEETRKSLQITQIMVRFPNGEKREMSLLGSDKIRTVYHRIDALGLSGIGGYRLVSSFPRKIYGPDQMGMSLGEAGLYPRATLFLELP